MGLKEGTFTGDSWLPVPTVLTKLTSSRACSSLSTPALRLARTKLYSSNSIAICVNRSDWHCESTRSV